jgi:hypothetical protein
VLIRISVTIKFLIWKTLMKRAGGLNGRKMSFHTGSRRSQPPLALSVPLSRFTSRVGGGSATLGKEEAFSSTQKHIPKYIIEREIAGAGKLTADQLQGISQKSCGVIKKLGPQIQWVESYVTDDKVYCVYIAPSEDLVREHAKQGGFPANRVSEVRGIIDPITAEA